MLTSCCKLVKFTCFLKDIASRDCCINVSTRWVAVDTSSYSVLAMVSHETDFSRFSSGCFRFSGSLGRIIKMGFYNQMQACSALEYCARDHHDDNLDVSDCFPCRLKSTQDLVCTIAFLVVDRSNHSLAFGERGFTCRCIHRVSHSCTMVSFA